MRLVKLMLMGLVLLTLADSGIVYGNGQKGRKSVYTGAIKMSDNKSCEFITEVEHVMFQLNSIDNKYKVVRIKIINNSDKKIKLSAENDKIEIKFPNDTIQGILSLTKQDSVLWDSLSDELRRDLVYPLSVEGKGEEENIFVFMPTENLNGSPVAFKYFINSLSGEEIYLVDRTAVKH